MEACWLKDASRLQGEYEDRYGVNLDDE
jgi:hypothetical protein